MKNYIKLARACGARHRCIASNNTEWKDKWESEISEILSRSFPHGSGFDSGTKIDLDASNDDKLVFTTAFHHMNESGMYDGWTKHTITVTASLGLEFRLKISGRNINEIKDYISECFQTALSDELVTCNDVPLATNN